MLQLNQKKNRQNPNRNLQGFIDIVNKKKENVKRLAGVVAKDYDIQMVNSKMEGLLNILECYDSGYIDNLDNFK
jgi:hypothetical protein